MGRQWSKRNNKGDSPLRNDGDLLQGLCVTVTQEERDISINKINTR